KMKIIIFCLIGFFVFQPIFAQSPYKLSWQKDGIIGCTNLAVVLTAPMVVDNIKPLTESKIANLSKNDLNWFDRSAVNNYSENLANASDVLLASIMLSPAGFIFFEDMREDYFILGTMYMETSLLAIFIPSYAKGGVKRIRPYVYNPDVSLEKKTKSDARESFFSRHTTVAFSSAVFFSSVYSAYFPNSEYEKYIWGGSLLLATTIGFLRYESGEHFPTDIITGAAVGSAIGYLIPYFHKRENPVNIGFHPAGNNSDYYLTLHFQF
ncbi:MAG: phosphatase PAP2 family protein, partial [Candidatus Cloacimonadota bacterium]|nr:phosphatase PAP2 family protein [Candidatus Cloacimonadota bacterium]